MFIHLCPSLFAFPFDNFNWLAHMPDEETHACVFLSGDKYLVMPVIKLIRSCYRVTYSSILSRLTFPSVTIPSIGEEALTILDKCYHTGIRSNTCPPKIGYNDRLHNIVLVKNWFPVLCLVQSKLSVWQHHSGVLNDTNLVLSWYLYNETSWMSTQWCQSVVYNNDNSVSV